MHYENALGIEEPGYVYLVRTAGRCCLAMSCGPCSVDLNSQLRSAGGGGVSSPGEDRAASAGDRVQLVILRAKGHHAGGAKEA